MKTRVYTSFTILFIPLSFILLFGCSKSTDPDLNSIDEAEKIVFVDILNKNDSGKVVYKLTEIVKAGNVINYPYISSSGFSSSTDNWFFFIDDKPDYYWAHDCRYVFVDIKTNKLTIYQGNYYPACYDDMVVVKF